VRGAKPTIAPPPAASRRTIGLARTVKSAAAPEWPAPTLLMQLVNSARVKADPASGEAEEARDNRVVAEGGVRSEST
jgi:hypothetical protein